MDISERKNHTKAEETSPKNPRKIRNVLKAIFVRGLLIIHGLLAVWRTADVLQNNYLWFLALPNILLVIEGLYCIIALKGNERKWFCPCFFLYLCCTVPSLWLLEMNRLDLFGQLTSSTNITNIVSDALSSIQGVTLPVTMDPDTWIEVLEQSLLFLLIVGRWLLPRGSLTRDQLSQLLFVYIGSASDVMELFVVFEENEVRNDWNLSMATLVVWTVSLLQFTLVLTATKSPKELQAVNDSNEQNLSKKHGCGICSCRKFFEIELWSLFISICLMDGPYLGIRLYALIVYRLLTYGILFFLSKNILMLGLLLYRIIIVCANFHSEKEKDRELTKTDAINTKHKSIRHHDSQDSGFMSHHTKSAGRTGKVSPIPNVKKQNDYDSDW